MSTNDATVIDAETIAAWAAMADLVIPAPCLPGVAANLAILRQHTARIEAAEGEAD